jgi:hypothetical protein
LNNKSALSNSLTYTNYRLHDNYNVYPLLTAIFPYKLDKLIPFTHIHIPHIHLPEMSRGDIERLNRLYDCPSSSEIPRETIANDDDDDDGSNGTNQQDDDDEDDMILTKEQIEAMYTMNSAKRNGLADVFKHWPGALVPYEIDPTFSECAKKPIEFRSKSNPCQSHQATSSS